MRFYILSILLISCGSSGENSLRLQTSCYDGQILYLDINSDGEYTYSGELKENCESSDSLMRFSQTGTMTSETDSLLAIFDAGSEVNIPVDWTIDFHTISIYNEAILDLYNGKGEFSARQSKCEDYNFQLSSNDNIADQICDFRGLGYESIDQWVFYGTIYTDGQGIIRDSKRYGIPGIGSTPESRSVELSNKNIFYKD